MDLEGILKEKNKKLEKLEYENLEMKDCLEKEQVSVKVCLECEMLKDKVIFITILLLLYINYSILIYCSCKIIIFQFVLYLCGVKSSNSIIIPDSTNLDFKNFRILVLIE